MSTSKVDLWKPNGLSGGLGIIPIAKIHSYIYFGLIFPSSDFAINISQAHEYSRWTRTIHGRWQAMVSKIDPTLVKMMVAPPRQRAGFHNLSNNADTETWCSLVLSDLNTDQTKAHSKPVKKLGSHTSSVPRSIDFSVRTRRSCASGLV